MRREAPFRLPVWVKVAVTAALLAASLALVPFDALAGRLARADAGWLAVSATLLTLGGFAGAASWFFVIRSGLPGLSYREVAACHWSGMFFNTFLPSNVGGDVVKGYIITQRQGRTGFVVMSLLIDRALNLGVLVAFGLFALLLELDRAGWAAAFGAALLLLFAAAPALARRVGKRMDRWPREGLRGKVAGLARPFIGLAGQPRLFFATLLAAFASQALKTWHNVFVVLAFGLKIPALCVWYLIPVLGIVSALPVTIGGLGLREMVAQGMSGPLKADNAELLTLSLAGYLMVVLVNLLGAIPFFFARRKKTDHEADTPRPVVTEGETVPEQPSSLNG